MSFRFSRSWVVWVEYTLFRWAFFTRPINVTDSALVPHRLDSTVFLGTHSLLVATEIAACRVSNNHPRSRKKSSWRFPYLVKLLLLPCEATVTSISNEQLYLPTHPKKQVWSTRLSSIIMSSVEDGAGGGSSTHSSRLKKSSTSGMESSILRFKNLNFVVGKGNKQRNILTDVSGTHNFERFGAYSFKI